MTFLNIWNFPQLKPVCFAMRRLTGYNRKTTVKFHADLSDRCLVIWLDTDKDRHGHTHTRPITISFSDVCDAYKLIVGNSEADGRRMFAGCGSCNSIRPAGVVPLVVAATFACGEQELGEDERLLSAAHQGLCRRLAGRFRSSSASPSLSRLLTTVPRPQPKK